MMTDIEKKAKAIVYKAARAVEHWRECHKGHEPVVLMSATQIATVAMGAPGVIDVRENRGTMLGCYLDVVTDDGADGERIYLAEEVKV